LLKPPRTIDEQIKLLKIRNIVIGSAEAAENFLENNNYYRLMGYAFQFKKDKDYYIPDTKFSTIAGIYNFDKLLRRITLSSIEELEISFKTKLVYFLSHKYGSECYLKKEIFIKNESYLDFKNIIKKNIKQSNSESFVKHHLIKYDAVFIENWIHHFSVLRNTCTHYGRIYNKNLLPVLKFLEEDKNKIIRTTKLFDSLFILNKIFFNRDLWSNFLERLNNLIIEYKNIIDLNLIGFPDNYLSVLKNA